MSDLKKESYLRRRFHCTCDLSPWWGRISSKVAAFGILPIALLWYLVRWFTGDPLASLEVSFLQGLLLPVQRVVSSTRILDPFVLAAVGGLTLYSVGMAILLAIWERSLRPSWVISEIIVALLATAFLGAFAVATMMYGSFFAACLLLPVVLALLLLVCLRAGAVSLWGLLQFFRAPTGVTRSS